MTEIPLASKSDPGKSDLVTKERLLNLYAEQSPSSSRSAFALYRTPGLPSYIPISSELCRGLISLEDQGTLLSLFGSTLYQSDADKNYNAISGVVLGNDDVVLARNTASPDPQVMICTSSATYYTDGSTLTQITDTQLTDFGIPHSAAFIKGFMIVGFTDGTMLASDIQDVSSWDSLNFAKADAMPDDLRRVYPFRDELLAMGKDGIEFWAYDASNTAFPLSPIPGAVVPVGLMGRHSVTDLGGVIYWLDQYGIFRSLSQGYSAQRISKHGLERDVSDYLKAGNSRDGIKVWGYIEGGHQFIVVRASTFCWVHDAATQIWHERRSKNRDTWRAKHYARCFDTHIVSSDNTGNLYSLDESYYAEGNDRITWEAILPPIDNFPNGGVLDRLSLDIETGTAVDGSGDEEDQNPTIIVDWSVNGGRTWSIPRQVSLGKRAEYRKRLTVNRMGSFGREGIMFRLRGSAKVRMAILRADLSARPRLN